MTAAEADGGRGGDGREAAYRATLSVLRGAGFAGQTIRALRSVGDLSVRDAALALEIALGAVRHWITSEHVLSAVARFDPRRVRPELRAILSAAAYQVIWMDRVPVFAAVDEAVGQARRHVGGRSPGMVNALLRNLVRAVADRRAPWERLNPSHIRVSWDLACTFSVEVLPPAPTAEDLEHHLAVAAGERLPRFHELVSRHGAEAAEQIAWASQAVPPVVLQRNALRAGAQDFVQALHASWSNVAHGGANSGRENVEITPEAAFLPPAAHLSALEPFGLGWAYVQDQTAHAAALLVQARPNERILDLCAAPGGKSVALAIQMANTGEVVACDASAERLARVTENLARLGVTCVHTSPPPARTPQAPPPLGLFDAALVDVPCANTGVLARRPEARLSLAADKLTSLVQAQRELLSVAAQHVRPGGRLVYSTCSLEPEENERQVTWFLRKHPDWSLEQEQMTWPAWGARLSDWRDGGYAARLGRRGGR